MASRHKIRWRHRSCCFLGFLIEFDVVIDQWGHFCYSLGDMLKSSSVSFLPNIPPKIQ
jgi:hypothetical protein